MKSVAMVLHFLKLPSIFLTAIFTQKGMNIQPWYSYFSREKNHPQNRSINYNSLMLFITVSIWPRLYFYFSYQFEIFYPVKCKCSSVFPSPSGERGFSHYEMWLLTFHIWQLTVKMDTVWCTLEPYGRRKRVFLHLLHCADSQRVSQIF